MAGRRHADCKMGTSRRRRSLEILCSSLQIALAICSNRLALGHGFRHVHNLMTTLFDIPLRKSFTEGVCEKVRMLLMFTGAFGLEELPLAS